MQASIPTILVVDDNAEMQTRIKELLQIRYNVVTANNGNDALDKFKEYGPKLILTGITASETETIEWVKNLKENPNSDTIPVILVAAPSAVGADAIKYSTVADDYLIKPFSPNDLLSKVESQLSNAQRKDKILQSVYTLFDDVPFAVAVLKGESLIIEFINKYNLAIWGCQREEVLGKPLFEARPGMRADAEAIHDEVYRTGKRFSADEVQFRQLTKDGNEDRYFNAMIDPMFDEHGKVVGQFATSIEITDQVLARKRSQEDELHFSSLANAMPQLVWIAEPSGAVFYYNNRITEFAGATQLEDGAWQWEGMVHPDDKAATDKMWDSAIKTGSTYEIEHRIQMRDGAYRWFLSRAVPQKDTDGIILQWFGTATDIHQQKEAAEQVKESEEQLRIAIEGGELGLYAFYPHTGKLVWSAKAKEFFGLLPDTEVTFDHYREGMHPDDRAAAEAVVDAALRPENGGTYENEYRTIGITDGKMRWIRSKGKVIFDEQGQPLRFTGVTQDITGQKAILASLQMQSLVLDRMDEGVSISDENGVILLTNPAEDKMFGYEPGELTGQHVTIQNAYDSEENNAIVNHVISEVKSKGFWNGDWHNRKKDGTEFYTYSFITSLVVENQTLLVCVQRDITEDKLAAENLAYRTALLEAQNEAIPDALLIVDTKGKILSYNHQFVAMWNLPQDIIDHRDDDAALAHSMKQVVNPEEFIRKVQYCYSNPTEKNHEEVVFRDGRIIERYGNAIVGDDGKSYGWAWYFRDVTERSQSDAKIRESEARFRSLADESPMFVFIIEKDPKAPVSYWNKTWLTYTGQTAEEATGTGWNGIIHPDDLSIVMEHYLPKFELEQEYVIPAVRVKRHDNEYRWHTFKGNPRISPAGEFDGYIGVGFDIHEQKLAEQALKATKEQLELTFKNVPSGIYHFDKNGKILYLNEIGALQLGYQSIDEIEGNDVAALTEKLLRTYKLFDSKGREMRNYESSAALTFRTGKASEVICQYMHREDNSSFWLLSKSSPLFNEKGELTIVLTTSTDITLQKLSEKAIRESENRFRTMAETLPQLIWVRSMDGVLEYVSKSWEEYTGFADLKEAWPQVTHAEDWEPIMTMWQNASAVGKPFRHEVRIRHKDGEYRWHHAVGEPVRDDFGNVTKFIGAMTDIHSQKTFAEKLEKLVAERTKELQRSNEDLQQFAHVASHDLKEPVRKIRTFGNRLHDEFGNEMPETAKKYLVKMESAAARLATMIDGVLMYSSLDSEVGRNQHVDLQKTICQIEEDLELLIAQKNAVIRYDLLPTIEASPILMYQLFYNLINNSLKFAQADVPAKITINSEQVDKKDLVKYNLKGEPDSYVKLMVTDNGIGFNASEAEKIFVTFSRLHSKDAYEGTGLGLALCKKIVERHHGAISAESSAKQGATFRIILPVAYEA